MNQFSNMRKLRIIGISGAIAVALGALGAHWLKTRLGPDQLTGFETGVRYHLMHVLAMFVCVMLSEQIQSRFIRYAQTFFFWGIILFSGSIYLLTTRFLLDAPWLSVLGPITPLGGICLITGWVLIAVAGITKKVNG